MVLALGGVTKTSIILSLVFTCFVGVIEVKYRAKARIRDCVSSDLILFIGVLCLCNAMMTWAAAAIGVETWVSWVSKVAGLELAEKQFAPLAKVFLYAVLGVVVFQIVLSNTNITVFNKGYGTIQNWIGQAVRDPAVAAAVAKRVARVNELETRIEQDLRHLPDGELNAYLSRHCGGAEAVTQAEHEAKQSGANPKLYKALKLVDCAPNKAAALLKVVKKRK